MTTEVNVPSSYIQAGDTAFGLHAGAIAQLEMSKIRINAQTGSYTLGLADAAGSVEINSATTCTVTIPDNTAVALPVGVAVLVYSVGVGVVTVSAAAGVTLNGVSAGSFAISGPAGAATLLKRSANIWVALNRTDVA